MPTYTIRNTSVQDWRDSMMSKAEFNAVAAERRANRAGSGFDEFGKYRSGYVNVNDGIWVNPSVPNTFYMGYDAGIGVSKTDYSIPSINGIIQNIRYLGQSAHGALLLLPPAPTVYPYGTTLTAEQIAMGCITHADASNSGLIVNGKFDTDTSGWTALNATLSVDAGRLKLTNTSTAQGYAYQAYNVVVGKKYVVEFEQQYGNKTGAVRVGTTNIGGEYFNTFDSSTDGVSRRTQVEFTATVSTVYITTTTSAGLANDYRFFDNVAVFPADAISRRDLVFLESWHEDVSEKDFVYPYGNTQYLGTTGDAGTPVAGTFTGYGTYSLFGNWQASGALVGKGYVWSTLSDANKKAFVANPENNCYLDGDKVIQVRYRVRVVAGLGDSWYTPMFAYNDVLKYAASSFYITPKGKNTGISSDAGSVSNGLFGGFAHSYVDGVSQITGDYGVLQAVAASDTLFNGAYEGKCFALPIALVHRRNQGAYHPVYNANGTKKASDGNNWYNTVVAFTSIADTLTDTKLTTATGYIGTTTGRPDGLFYDQIHEGDITDLRMSSQKVEDYNRLIDREFSKLVAGTYRGSEGEWECKEIYNTTISVINTSAGGGNYVQIGVGTTIGADGYFPADTFSKNYVFVNTTTGKVLSTGYTEATSIYFNKIWDATPASGMSVGNNVTIYKFEKSTRTKSNTLLHCDIIGNPANYPTSWKQSGISGAPLIVAEDGTSMLPTGSLTTFKLSRKANASPLQVLKSTDSGATWTALTVTTHYTFSTTTNVLTMVTAPAATDLIMVTYQTHTNMAVPAVNSEVLAIGDVSAGYSSVGTTYGYIANSLIGKVQDSNAGVNQNRKLGLPYINYITPSDGKINSAYTVSHFTTSLSGTTSPTVKTFPYLTRSNGKAYLNLVFKEMKHNGTSWGDDNKFNIVDNVSTTTDTNGATVLIGQKKVELPYFIGAGE